MKVLFYCFEPFALAPGPKQEQITRTRGGLGELNVEVEFLRWYDGTQKGDVLHFFGRITTDLLALAHDSGMKVVVTDWLAEQARSSGFRLYLQRYAMHLLTRAAPGAVTEIFHWQSYRLADACVVETQPEADLLANRFGVPPAKIKILPNGVENVGPKQGAGWLNTARQLKDLYEKLAATRKPGDR